MPKIETPDPAVDPDRGDGVLQKMDHAHALDEHVACPDDAAPAPTTPPVRPRARWEARIRHDGSVVIPASMISPVMGAVLGWWSSMDPSAADQAAARRRISLPSADRFPDDAIIDQRSGLVPKDLFLRLARQGAFPSRKVGKRVLAVWGEVRRALLPEQPVLVESSAKPREDQHDSLDSLRMRWGLAPAGRR